MHAPVNLNITKRDVLQQRIRFMISCFSAVSLADADFRVQFLEKAVIFKHFQSRDEITIAGTAGFYFFYCILKFYLFSCFRKFFAGIFLTVYDVGIFQISTSNPKLLCQFNIRYIFRCIMHDLTYIRIDQYRIRPRPDTVHHYRISAIVRQRSHVH